MSERHPIARSSRPTARGRGLRLLLAGGIVASVATGFLVRSIFTTSLEGPPAPEEVRAGATAPVSAEQPPVAPTTGWQPGLSAEAETTVPGSAVNGTANTWPADLAIVSNAPPLVPSDMAVPESGMVAIAAPARSVARTRAAAARGQVFTNDDLEARREPAAQPPTY